MAAIVAAGLSSCSKESVVDTEINKTGNAINFGSYATRGVPVADNTAFAVSGSAFGVSAFISTDATNPYMGTTTEGTQIVYGTTAWDYATASDLRYWPTGDETLDFYAYAPYNHESINSKSFTSTAGVVLDVTIPAEATQADIMFAEAKTVATPSPIAAQELLFKHALTQVKFAARTATEGLFVDINGIVLKNICSKGIFTSSTAAWTSIETLADYTVKNAAVVASYDNDADTDGQQLAAIGDENVLMLIPQKLSAVVIDTDKLPKVGDTGAYAVISCKIYQKTVGENPTNVYLIGDVDTYADVYVPISSQNSDKEEIWNRAKIVTYNLLIGAGSATGLEPITFSTDVEEWTVATNAGDWSNE